MRGTPDGISIIREVSRQFVQSFRERRIRSVFDSARQVYSAPQSSNMAAPVKKRNQNVDEEKPPKGDGNEKYEGENVLNETVVQVDFEGRNPIDSDIHGIKQLLNQLFLKARLNVSELAELIIGQNYIGSVIKQAEAEEETDEEDSDPNEVFGVTTVINLTGKQNYESVSQLRSLLLEFSSEHSPDDVHSFIQNLLSDNSKPVGLLINERFVNIPPQIAVPLLKSLKCELRRAIEKKMAYDFSHIILICKLYKMGSRNSDKKKSKKSKKVGLDSEIIWCNPEEEIIDQEAEVKFEFSVKNEADSGLAGEWNENDEEMTPMRRILVIPFNKLDRIIEKVEEAVTA